PITQKFALSQERRTKRDAALAHAYAELSLARDRLFLHLAGHSGLPRAAVARGVRIRIEWERAVHVGALVETAGPVPDPVVVLGQALHRHLVVAAIDGRVEPLLHGEQELSHHVPVDAAEPL